ncbi:MAG: ASKHA domain-containing protein [Phycisphaerae bacterium]|nr:ASKHA domain-containing protein [Phycisphaerae bacterium]
MKHFTVTFNPDAITVKIHGGATLLEAAGQAGIILNTACGGQGLCGKCSVIIENEGEVLACKYIIESDLTVTILNKSRFFEQKILSSGIETQIHVHPTVCKKFVKPLPADFDELPGILAAGCPSEKYTLEDGIRGKNARFDTETHEKGATFVCHLTPDSDNGEKYRYLVVDVEAGDTTTELFGLAIDIGTTTVVVKLIDMATGKVIATEADENPQRRFGDDVISRITFAETDENLKKLQSVIINCLNTLTKKLCGSAGINPGSIYEVAAVGNTTMHHLFLGLPVKQLGQAPYHPFSVESFDRTAAEMGFAINPIANIHTVENIAGFVGADTVAMGLAIDIGNAEKMTLAVDIGTNGELILGTKDKLYSASCAAGPALEGARISQGNRAVNGAIEAVVINEHDIDLDVIGGGTPHCICGSGLIDAVAVMLELGIIDTTGRILFKSNLDGKVSEKILSRLLEKNNQPAFCLAFDKKGKPAVILTQKDVREFQLAKAAIRTGIKLLQKKAGVDDNGLSQILLAGAFGNYIRRESAVRTGLLPSIPIEKIKFVGNAASSGARMILLSRNMQAQASELARKIEYIEIAHLPEFTVVYADSMMF